MTFVNKTTIFYHKSIILTNHEKQSRFYSVRHHKVIQTRRHIIHLINIAKYGTAFYFCIYFQQLLFVRIFKLNEKYYKIILYQLYYIEVLSYFRPNISFISFIPFVQFFDAFPRVQFDLPMYKDMKSCSRKRNMDRKQNVKQISMIEEYVLFKQHTLDTILLEVILSISRAKCLKNIFP